VHERDLTFPPFRLDLANERLWRGSELLALRPKAFLLLRYLAEHPERLVTQEELLKVVWQHNFVSDGLLRGYIRELRQVLGDDAKPRAASGPRARGVTGSSPRSLPSTRVPSGRADLPPAIAPQLRKFFFDEELLLWNEYGNSRPCPRP
jgi:hypothetical protein